MQWVRHGVNKKNRTPRFTQNLTPVAAEGKRSEAMETASDIANLTDRIALLEKTIRAQNNLLVDLSERIGETFAKQAFTVEDLMKRWGCGETCARNIIRKHKLTLLRGANGKPRSPIAVLRSSVLAYENGSTQLSPFQRKPRPAPSWSENPFLPIPELKAPFGKGVRRLGEYPCELPQAKSRAPKRA